MRKGRGFHASKRVLWSIRHRLLFGQRSVFPMSFHERCIISTTREKEFDVPEPPEDNENPQWIDMGPEYSSDQAGNDHVSSDD